MLELGWFDRPGAYAVVDGQFGSTGKGLICGYLGGHFYDTITHYTTNAGPNSGHTSYFHGERVMLQQLPMGAVIAGLVAESKGKIFGGIIHLNSGAVIDLAQLMKEASVYNRFHEIWVDPNAVVIDDIDREAEANQYSGAARIASTAKGVGHAISRKINRTAKVYGDLYISAMKPVTFRWDWKWHKAMVEVSQGFSLGLNSGFYPHCTSRECTVQQAIADARIAPKSLLKTLATFRTYPIRVGNTTVGFSGDCYPDQRELQWADLGIPPETTTVTGRQRRIFSWSRQQFDDCLRVQEPDAIFLNFMNYLPENEQAGFISDVAKRYRHVLGRDPDFIALGYGPEEADVQIIYPS